MTKIGVANFLFYSEPPDMSFFLGKSKVKKVKISGPKGPYTTWFENGTVHMVGYLPNSKKESSMFHPLAAPFDEKNGFGLKSNGINPPSNLRGPCPAAHLRELPDLRAEHILNL